MRYRKLTGGDYTFGNSQLDFYRDTPEAVGQSVQTRLLLWLGEWFLNVDDGTTYMTGILGKRSQDEADSTIRQRILSTSGVTGIENYESSINPDTRSMLVTCDLNTIFGPTQVQIDSYKNY